MKLKPFLLVAAIVPSCSTVITQPTIKEDFKPSSLNQPGQEYSPINSQGYARFNLE